MSAIAGDRWKERSTMPIRRKRRTTRAARKRRHARVRKRVHGTPQRPRLAVFRSLNHIYGQIIDDDQGATLAAASDLNAPNGSKTERAAAVGQQLAQAAQAAGVSAVVFDRGGYRYHGRVRALAEAARKNGLQF